MRIHLKVALSILALAALVAALPAPAHANANIVIVNLNAPGEGFNDPTPAAPVGGNPGTTVGQQRLNAFQFAASVWSAVLDSPSTIYIDARFFPLTCTPTAATLGSAGAIQIFANSPGVEINNIWYHVALASKLAGGDLSTGPTGTPGPSGSPGIVSAADDIVATFNSLLNGSASCLGGRRWYYGFDNAHGTNIDLVTVLMHEFGHGLGFATFANKSTGAEPLGLGDIFAQYTLDVATGKTWNQMTNAERATSAINTNKVVWNGIHVNQAALTRLAPGTPLLRINSPASLVVSHLVGPAVFGPALSSPGVTGNVVVGLDPSNAAGLSTTDACSPLTNAAAVAGNIALVDRGTCGFIVKVKNAQNAGAIAVLVADNVAGSPPAGLGGADPTITIPSVRVTLPDGNAIKAALSSGAVNVTLGVDMTVRQGAEPATGKTLLYAPNPVITGSSISHWDISAFPNLLMEPAINADLTHDLDLTLPEMVDIGWFSDGDGVPDGVDQCIGSDRHTTVVVDGCDSGAPNTVFTTGCRISDQVADCARGASNHGAFVSCVAHLTNDLKSAGFLSGAQKGAIQSCAGQANIP
jgi:PA domain-containing protein